MTTEIEIEKILRYTVGATIPFLSLEFKYPNGNITQIGNGSTYRPWEGGLISLNVVELVCLEHRRVPNSYGLPNELECDGFIFVEADDRHQQWLNQYPRASYSQTSTEADYDVHCMRPHRARPLFMREAKRYLEIAHECIYWFDKDQTFYRDSMLAMVKDVETALTEKGWKTTVKPFVYEGKKVEGMFDVALTKEAGQGVPHGNAA